MFGCDHRPQIRRNLSGIVGADFQILAHFMQPLRCGPSPAFGRREAKRAAERFAEMAVAGEPQIEREFGQIRFMLDESFQRCPQAQAVAILVQRQAALAMENPGELNG